METKKTPEGVMPKEQLPHPDAKYHGKESRVDFEINGLKISIHITLDLRDPKEWGSRPVHITAEPLIRSSNFETLHELEILGLQLNGKLGEKIFQAVREITEK